MKVSSEVTAAKLRGGFYSPAPLVQVCLDRVEELARGEGPLRVLEPSAGDGAFIRGLAVHDLAQRVKHATAIELLDTEAQACAAAVAAAPFTGEVVNESVLAWALRDRESYDVAVGNPPFVRFQFVEPNERPRMLALGRKHRAEFKGVSNLWLPVLIAALGSLRPGGAFAFIVPAECFTGISGHEVRQWLLQHVRSLNVDLFAPGSFPGVLQEVVVLSGTTVEEGHAPRRELRMREHGPVGHREWVHRGLGAQRTWTRYLLTPAQVASLEAASQLEAVRKLGDVARFEVATVTGANSFFCVNAETIDRFGLGQWTRPLLPRTRHATGILYGADDQTAVEANGLSGYLLDFSASRLEPVEFAGPREYLQSGEDDELHKRFKCRIREPWYRVPVVAPGAMMMAKRSHLFPRVIVNEANVVTTDTIYRGRLLPGAPFTARSFTAGFHNSLTLLTAEIEGRSFGGGVLELVPSEISRLFVPIADGIEDDFQYLDEVCRYDEQEETPRLVEETDRIVVKRTPGLSETQMSEIQDALSVLRGLRIDRNSLSENAIH